jgi:nitroreductase
MDLKELLRLAARYPRLSMPSHWRFVVVQIHALKAALRRGVRPTAADSSPQRSLLYSDMVDALDRMPDFPAILAAATSAMPGSAPRDLRQPVQRPSAAWGQARANIALGYLLHEHAESKITRPLHGFQPGR